MIKQCVMYDKEKDINGNNETRPAKPEAYSNPQRKAQPWRPS